MLDRSCIYFGVEEAWLKFPVFANRNLLRSMKLCILHVEGNGNNILYKGK